MLTNPKPARTIVAGSGTAADLHQEQAPVRRLSAGAVGVEVAAASDPVWCR